SKRMTRFQSVYTSGASAIGVPGCPDFACCTASIDKVRIVLIESWSSSAFVIVSSSFLQRRHLAEPPEMSLRPAALGSEERLDEACGPARARGARPKAGVFSLILLPPRPGGEVVVDRRGAAASDLVGTHRAPAPAPADRHPTIDLPRRDRPGEGHHEVRIVVV